MIAPNRSDRVYDAELHGGNVGPRCFCGQHAEVNRRYRCDREAVRAWHMDDPLFCFGCRSVFERGSVADPDVLGESLVGTCGDCQADREGIAPAPVPFTNRGLNWRRTMRQVDPHRAAWGFTPDEIALIHGEFE